jgi:hypothetical protein
MRSNVITLTAVIFFLLAGCVERPSITPLKSLKEPLEIPAMEENATERKASDAVSGPIAAEPHNIDSASLPTVQPGTRFEEGKPYDGILPPVLCVLGRPTYIAYQNEKYFPVFDGVEGKRYDDIVEPTAIGDKFAFIAKEGGRIGGEDGKEFVVFAGVEGKRYDKIAQTPLVDIDGLPAFTAIEDFKSSDDYKSFVVWGTKEIGREYDFAGWPVNIGGRLAYHAIRQKKHVIVFDGEELGAEYSEAWVAREVNGIPGYVARQGNQSFVVLNGTRGNGYDSIIDPVAVSGALAYIAHKDGKEFVVWGETEGPRYDIVPYLAAVEGRLVYFACNKTQYGCTWRVVFDGAELPVPPLAGGNNVAISFAVINGKLAYVAGGEEGDTYVIFDGKEVGTKYDRAEAPVAINGKLAYLAQEDGRSFVVFDEEEIGREYERVRGPLTACGKLSFIARKNNQSFLVAKQ